MKIVITQAVWGKKYIDLFAKYSLPSLLSENNVPSISRKHEITFLVYSTKSEINKLKKTKIVNELNKYVIFEWFELEGFGFNKWSIPGEAGNRKYAFLTNLHDHSVSYSKKYDVLMFNYADFIWGNGSVENIIDFYIKDVDAVLGFCLPVDQENFKIILDNKLSCNIKTNNDLNIPNNEFTELILSNLHREAQLRLWDGPLFSLVPTYLMWSVKDEGVILRGYHQTIFAMRTNLPYLNEGFLNMGSLDGYVSSLICESGNYKIASDSGLVSVCSLYETIIDSRAPPWITKDAALADCVRSSVTVAQRKLAMEPIFLRTKNRLNDSDWKIIEDKSASYLKLVHETIGFNEYRYKKSNKLEIVKNIVEGVSKTSYFDSIEYLLAVLGNKIEFIANHKSYALKIMARIIFIQNINSILLRFNSNGKTILISDLFRKILYIDQIEGKINSILFNLHKFSHEIERIKEIENFTKNIILNPCFDNPQNIKYVATEGIFCQLPQADWYAHFDINDDSSSESSQNIINVTVDSEPALDINFGKLAKTVYLANTIKLSEGNYKLTGKFEFSVSVENLSAENALVHIIIHVPLDSSFTKYKDNVAHFYIIQNNPNTTSTFSIEPNAASKCEGSFLLSPHYISLINKWGLRFCIGLEVKDTKNKVMRVYRPLLEIVDTSMDKINSHNNMLVDFGLYNYLKPIFNINVRLKFKEIINQKLGNYIRLMVLKTASFFTKLDNYYEENLNKYFIEKAINDLNDIIYTINILKLSNKEFLYLNLLKNINYLKKLSPNNAIVLRIEAYVKYKSGNDPLYLDSYLDADNIIKNSKRYNYSTLSEDSQSIFYDLEDEKFPGFYLDALSKYKILKKDNRTYNIYIDINHDDYLTKSVFYGYSNIFNIKNYNKTKEIAMSNFKMENWTIAIPSISGEEYWTREGMIKEVNRLWKLKGKNIKINESQIYWKLIKYNKKTKSNKIPKKITFVFSIKHKEGDDFLLSYLNEIQSLLLSLKLRCPSITLFIFEDYYKFFSNNILFNTNNGFKIFKYGCDIETLGNIYSEILDSNLVVSQSNNINHLCSEHDVPTILLADEIYNSLTENINNIVIPNKFLHYNILEKMPLMNYNQISTFPELVINKSQSKNTTFINNDEILKAISFFVNNISTRNYK
jgi:hypothetical protein